MSRWDEIKGQAFDVVVVGGGVYGATLTWVLTRAGKKVLLLEQGDYSRGASANSLKVLHGGLRYLQHMDLVRVRESIRARRHGLKKLPHMTHPQTYFMPTAGWGMRSAPVLTAGLLVNDAVSCDRNLGVDPKNRIRMGRIVSPSKVEAMTGMPAPQGSTGAACWHDGFVENTERFTLAYVLSARGEGARVRNYAKVQDVQTSGGRVTGVQIEDQLSGEKLEVNTASVVLTGGSWMPALCSTLGLEVSSEWTWTKSFNVVLRRSLFGKYGMGLESKRSYKDPDAIWQKETRNYFFTPWRTGCIAGTAYKQIDPGEGGAGLTQDEIQGFLDEINEVVPGVQLSMDDVCFAHVGILPSDSKPGNEDTPIKHAEVIDGATRGVKGLWLVRGDKYTTAVETGYRIARLMGIPFHRSMCEGPDAVLYGSAEGWDCKSVKSAAAAKGVSLEDAQAEWLSVQFGSNAKKVLECIEDEGAGHETLLKAAARYAIRNEQAATLDDLVFRRTDLGTFGYPGDVVINQIADTAARELQWDKAGKMQQIEQVKEEYRRLGLDHELKADS